jgi:hypothetical protein
VFAYLKRYVFCSPEVASDFPVADAIAVTQRAEIRIIQI